MFMNAMASVQFQDVTRQQIGHVISALERLDGHTATLADVLERGQDVTRDEALTPLTRQLEQIFDAYVMEHQRDTHQCSIQGGGAPKRTAAAPKRASNVELF
jgi:methyl-accepting chemotaxis protein